MHEEQMDEAEPKKKKHHGLKMDQHCGKCNSTPCECMKIADDEQRKKVHTRALRRFDESHQADYIERERCVEDIRFVTIPGAMWDQCRAGNYGQDTRADQRPKYEINKLSPIIQNICGEQQQNRTSIKVRSAKGGDSKKFADSLGGLIRDIEHKSNFALDLRLAQRRARIFHQKRPALTWQKIWH